MPAVTASVFWTCASMSEPPGWHVMEVEKIGGVSGGISMTPLDASVLLVRAEQSEHLGLLFVAQVVAGGTMRSPSWAETVLPAIGRHNRTARTKAGLLLAPRLRMGCQGVGTDQTLHFKLK